MTLQQVFLDPDLAGSESRKNSYCDEKVEKCPLWGAIKTILDVTSS